MLNATAQYALRAMALLAGEGSGRPLTGREIAERSGVPSNYLSKILLDLNHAGLVSAVRGTGGGYQLHRPAETIALIDIVAIFDHSRAGAVCMLFPYRECSDETACTAHEMWKDVRDSYAAFLGSTTLRDLSGFVSPPPPPAKARPRRRARADPPC
jgi:Rrf2 family iron-sulfur cluster assembly transcriptional regulator